MTLLVRRRCIDYWSVVGRRRAEFVYVRSYTASAASKLATTKQIQIARRMDGRWTMQNICNVNANYGGLLFNYIYVLFYTLQMKLLGCWGFGMIQSRVLIDLLLYSFPVSQPAIYVSSYGNSSSHSEWKRVALAELAGQGQSLCGFNERQRKKFNNQQMHPYDDLRTCIL